MLKFGAGDDSVGVAGKLEAFTHQGPREPLCHRGRRLYTRTQRHRKARRSLRVHPLGGRSSKRDSYVLRFGMPALAFAGPRLHLGERPIPRDALRQGAGAFLVAPFGASKGSGRVAPFVIPRLGQCLNLVAPRAALVTLEQFTAAQDKIYKPQLELGER